MGGRDRQVSGLTFPPEIADWLAGTNVPVVVTGAGGWLGRAALEMLEAALGSEFGSRVSGFAASERVIGQRSGRQIRLLPLGALESSGLRAPLVFHGAFLTREYASLIPLEEYVAANRAIRGVVERFVSRHGAMGIFVPSWGAVYGAHGVVGVPEQFTYYHVELATHELLLAEGAATKSFVDNVDRMHFSNWAEYEAPGGTVPIREMDYPRAKAYLQVPMHVRRMLDARAMAFTGCQGGYLIPADAQVQRAIRSLDSGTRTHRPCWRRPITGLIGYFCPGLNVWARVVDRFYNDFNVFQLLLSSHPARQARVNLQPL